MVRKFDPIQLQSVGHVDLDFGTDHLGARDWPPHCSSRFSPIAHFDLR